MEVCLNGKSVRMGFIIRLKATGEAVGDVGVIIPIEKMDDDNAWWEYGVLAYLHDRKKATRMDERNRYAVECKLDYQTRHAILDRVLTERAATKDLADAEKLRKREAKKAETVRRNVAKREAKSVQKKRLAPVPIPFETERPSTTPGVCPNPDCGYRDPHLGHDDITCPNCGS